nr:hypothetical protein [Streptomyces antibioticus]
MGRGSYEPGLAAGLTGPYAHLPQIVFSRSLGVSPDPAVEVTTGNPIALVRRLKQEEGLGIWLCGGADLVVAGSGIPLFRAAFSPRVFRLAGSRVFDNGSLILTYTKASAWKVIGPAGKFG